MLDVDGTLVHRAGDEVHVQPGAVEVLARIRASGRQLAIFTNGSHESPAWFAQGLRDAGLDIADDEMLTPLRSVRAYLRMRRLDGPVLPVRHRAGARVPARTRECRLAGDDGPVDAVFVAHADTVDFPLLERAARAVIARRAPPDRELRARLRRRERPDPQPRRDDDRGDREGEQHARR